MPDAAACFRSRQRSAASQNVGVGGQVRFSVKMRTPTSRTGRLCRPSWRALARAGPAVTVERFVEFVSFFGVPKRTLNFNTLVNSIANAGKIRVRRAASLTGLLKFSVLFGEVVVLQRNLSPRVNSSRLHVANSVAAGTPVAARAYVQEKNECASLPGVWEAGGKQVPDGTENAMAAPRRGYRSGKFTRTAGGASTMKSSRKWTALRRDTHRALQRIE